MARINIEDSIYQDQRFIDLVIQCGSLDFALGALIRAWSLAQKWYLTPDKMIPINVWSDRKIPQAIVSVGLAEVVGEKIRVKGADEQFKWLIQRQEAGKRGGLKSQKNKRSDRQAVVKQKQPSSSSSSSSSSSCSLSSSNSDSISKDLNLPAHPPGATVATWESYRDAYEKRYGEAPIRNATVNGQLSQLIKRLGAEEAPQVAEFYLTHTDAYYLKSMHPVGLLLRDAEKLRTEWATGNKMLGSKAREIERQQHSSDNWKEGARILNERRKTNAAV